MLPLRWLRYFVLEVDKDGRLKLPVLSLRPKKKPVAGEPMLSYILRFRPDFPLKGRVALRRRGRFVTRRRRFSSLLFVDRPSTLDVAW